MEGAGVRICRTLGTPALRNLDPFLMLDELKMPAHEVRRFCGFYCLSCDPERFLMLDELKTPAHKVSRCSDAARLLYPPACTVLHQACPADGTGIYSTTHLCCARCAGGSGLPRPPPPRLRDLLHVSGHVTSWCLRQAVLSGSREAGEATPPSEFALVLQCMRSNLNQFRRDLTPPLLQHAAWQDGARRLDGQQGRHWRWCVWWLEMTCRSPALLTQQVTVCSSTFGQPVA